MQIRRVRNEEAALRRYVEECWSPYHEDLRDAVAVNSLVDDIDGQDVVAFYLDLLDSPTNPLWVALEDVDDPTASLSAVDAIFAGFVRTSLKPSPSSSTGPTDSQSVTSGYASSIAGRGSPTT
jgi:hypothetical protein